MIGGCCEQRYSRGAATLSRAAAAGVAALVLAVRWVTAVVLSHVLGRDRVVGAARDHKSRGGGFRSMGPWPQYLAAAEGDDGLRLYTEVGGGPIEGNGHS